MSDFALAFVTSFASVVFLERPAPRLVYVFLTRGLAFAGLAITEIVLPKLVVLSCAAVPFELDESERPVKSNTEEATEAGVGRDAGGGSTERRLDKSDVFVDCGGASFDPCAVAFSSAEGTDGSRARLD